MVITLWGRKEETERHMNVAGRTLLLGECRRLEKGGSEGGIIRS